MAESRFVYVTYIRTTPEKLWQALTDPEFTRRYWVESWQECAWTPGSAWKLRVPGGSAAAGEVLEIDPPRRLVLSCRASEVFPEAHLEGYGRITYELEQQNESVKLTFIQEIDKPDAEVIRMASNGWPLILASLKSLLETGEPLEETRHFPKAPGDR
jgi:uncharacterized protein YndB with AHSA1/START domain